MKPVDDDRLWCDLFTAALVGSASLVASQSASITKLAKIAEDIADLGCDLHLCKVKEPKVVYIVPEKQRDVLVAALADGLAGNSGRTLSTRKRKEARHSIRAALRLLRAANIPDEEVSDGG